jgi:succinate dehydrogenase hydrophobic anchor subunit
MQWLGTLWRGEHTLGRAYWWYLVVIGNLLLSRLLVYAAFFIAASTQQPFWAHAALLVTFVYFVIAGVGVWRSARSYEGSAIWKFLARAVVVVNFVLLVIYLIAGFFADPSEWLAS